MKWGINPNQSSIRYFKVFKAKKIKVIKIDPQNKTVEYFEIENFVQYLQEIQIFYNYKHFFINGERDCIIYGIDDDLKEDNSFTIKGCDIVFLGKAVVVGVLPSKNLDNLKDTFVPIKHLKSFIEFK